MSDHNQEAVRRPTRFRKAKTARLFGFQKGPNSFLVRGELGDKKRYRVNIGPQTCTCGKKKCIHLLFVMIRILQVNESSHLLSQDTLKNYEVDQLLEAYAKRRNEAKDSARAIAISNEKQKELQGNIQRRSIEDAECPICLTSISDEKETNLTWCQLGCGNNVHRYCMGIWIEEKQDIMESILCPLCRHPWGDDQMNQHICPTINAYTEEGPGSRCLAQFETEFGRLPQAEVLSSEQRDRHTLLIRVFGEELVQCVESRKWTSRQIAVERADGILNMLPVQMMSDEIFKAYMKLLAFVSEDKIDRVFMAALPLLRTLIDNFAVHVSPPIVRSGVRALLPSLLDRSASMHPRLRDDSRDLIMFLATHRGVGVHVVYRQLVQRDDNGVWKKLLVRAELLLRLCTASNDFHDFLGPVQYERFLLFCRHALTHPNQSVRRVAILCTIEIFKLAPQKTREFIGTVRPALREVLTRRIREVPLCLIRPLAFDGDDGEKLLKKQAIWPETDVESPPHTPRDGSNGWAQSAPVSIEEDNGVGIGGDAANGLAESAVEEGGEGEVEEGDPACEGLLEASRGGSLNSQGNLSENIVSIANSALSEGEDSGAGLSHHSDLTSGATLDTIAEEVVLEETAAASPQLVVSGENECSLEEAPDAVDTASEAVEERLTPGSATRATCKAKSRSTLHGGIDAADEVDMDAAQLVADGGDWDKRLRDAIESDATLSSWLIEDFRDEVTLMETVGRGGFGEVLRGDWHGTQVAVKRLYTAPCPGSGGGSHFADAAAREEFIHETRVLASLRHPNLVLFMGMAICPPDLFIVTEYMGLGSLYRLLHRYKSQNTRMDLPRVHHVASCVARAMGYLHRNSALIHRDLKSPNILVSPSWEVKVADFGLSYSTHGGPDAAGQGTPGWMAPEQLRGERITPAVDVFAFGVVLWEMLTCRVPWDRIDYQRIKVEVGMRDARLPVPSPAAPQNSTSAKMELVFLDLIRACWRSEPSSRPAFPAIISLLRDCHPSRVAQGSGSGSS